MTAYRETDRNLNLLYRINLMAQIDLITNMLNSIALKKAQCKEYLDKFNPNKINSAKSNTVNINELFDDNDDEFEPSYEYSSCRREILKAMNELNCRGGVSRQSIKKYINARTRINSNKVHNELKKLVADGLLRQPKGPSGAYHIRDEDYLFIYLLVT